MRARAVLIVLGASIPRHHRHRRRLVLIAQFCESFKSVAPVGFDRALCAKTATKSCVFFVALWLRQHRTAGLRIFEFDLNALYISLTVKSEHIQFKILTYTVFKGL